MRVQRQVRTVNREVILDQQPEQFIAFRRPGMAGTPEQPVMHDQQFGPGRSGQLHGRQTGVHRRGDSLHRAAIFHLQPVDRPFPVTELIRAQQPITKAHDGRQRNF